MNEIYLVKAFSNSSTLGNPAGVCVDASRLTVKQMQSIAVDLGYSESVFVLPSDKADYRTRFFTPKLEVDYCGHATIASYHELFHLPENIGKTLLTQDTSAGIFKIEKSFDGKIMMNQKNPTFLDIEDDYDLLARLLGIPSELISREYPMQVVATNVAKLMVPIIDSEGLRKIKPNYKKLSEYINSQSGKGIYCFTKSIDMKYDFYARFFNPAVGISEDPATGVAAGPLGSYADRYIFKGSKKQLTINQGMWMGKSSEIYAELSDGVKVGGYAVRFGERGYTPGNNNQMKAHRDY